jgi:hypothetical protein
MQIKKFESFSRENLLARNPNTIEQNISALEGSSFVRPPYFILWESREILMRQQKQQQPAPPAHSQL